MHFDSILKLLVEFEYPGTLTEVESKQALRLVKSHLVMKDGVAYWVPAADGAEHLRRYLVTNFGIGDEDFINHAKSQGILALKFTEIPAALVMLRSAIATHQERHPDEALEHDLNLWSALCQL